MEHAPEPKVDTNAWALTYGDMITLLMTFFILIIAMSSSPDEHIVEEINQNHGIGDFIIVSDSYEGGMYDGMIANVPETWIDAEDIPPPVDDLDIIRQEMVVFMTENDLYEVIDLSKTEEGFAIRIRADILFDPGKTEIKEDSQFLLKKIADLLYMLPNHVRVDGHTDGRYSGEYDADYKLSIARASSVCGYFTQLESLASSRFGVAGFGRHRPLYPNNNESNREKNRRVEIIIKELNNNA